MNKHDHNLSKLRTYNGYFHQQTYHKWTSNIHSWWQTSTFRCQTYIFATFESHVSRISHIMTRFWHFPRTILPQISQQQYGVIDLNRWHDDVNRWHHGPSFFGSWACRQRFLSTRSTVLHLTSPPNLPFMDHMRVDNVLCRHAALFST